MAADNVPGYGGPATVRPWLSSRCRAGDFRYYYYEPAPGGVPYLIRDRYNSGGLLGGGAGLPAGGAALDRRQMAGQAPIASRLLARAKLIYAASQGDQRLAVLRANWLARKADLEAERAQWTADLAESRDWRAYHAKHPR